MTKPGFNRIMTRTYKNNVTLMYIIIALFFGSVTVLPKPFENSLAEGVTICG